MVVALWCATIVLVTLIVGVTIVRLARERLEFEERTLMSKLELHQAITERLKLYGVDKDGQLNWTGRSIEQAIALQLSGTKADV